MTGSISSTVLTVLTLIALSVVRTEAGGLRWLLQADGAPAVVMIDGTTPLPLVAMDAAASLGRLLAEDVAASACNATRDWCEGQRSAGDHTAALARLRSSDFPSAAPLPSATRELEFRTCVEAVLVDEMGGDRWEWCRDFSEGRADCGSPVLPQDVQTFYVGKVSELCHVLSEEGA
mmetsp:Transcript_93/g.305  ORF Transcript_93/g.305 Transcript_93/m.305 type:complete len:176 (+) Transcript_93:325-852(+)